MEKMVSDKLPIEDLLLALVSTSTRGGLYLPIDAIIRFALF